MNPISHPIRNPILNGIRDSKRRGNGNDNGNGRDRGNVSSSLAANRSATRQVDNGLSADEARRILRAARVEITRVLGPIRQWPPNMRPESILAQHEADAEAIAEATNRVVGRMYAERRRKSEQVRYHRQKLRELGIGEAMGS